MTAYRMLVCLLLSAPLLGGCGGGPSKNDLLERARMRSAMNKINEAEEETNEETHEETNKETQQATQPPVETHHEEPVAPQAGAADQASAASGPGPVEAGAGQAAPAAVATLDPQERDRQAADKLRRIATAVLAYAQEHNEFPQQGAKGLSWRVRILPQLGHQALYEQFNLNQAWDGPQNKALLSQMPDVFRSPGRPDDRTSFFAAGGPATIFWHPGRVTRFSALGENAGNTLMLVEGADAAAVPWTQPTDLQRDPDDPTKDLASRGDAPLVVWADGVVNRLVLTSSTPKLSDAFRLYEEDEVKPLKTADITAPVDQPAGIASSPGRGESDPGVPGGLSAATRAAATRPTSELAASYLAAAQAAFLQGDRGEAWAWYSGAILAGLPVTQWRDDFRWTPGLRRPTLGPHIAVGVLLDLAPTRPTGRGSGSEDWMKQALDATAPIGAHLVRILDEHADSRLPAPLRPAEAARARPRRPNELPGRVTCLAPSTHMGEIRRDAIDSGCDVLALFAVDNSGTRRTRSIELRLFDMQRGAKQLLRVRKVAAEVDEDPLTDETEERLQAARWQLKDFLQDSLTPGEWPVKLTKELAAKRLESLAEGREEQPLPSLIEMLHYRDLGLADDVQLLRSFSGLLGDERAAPLLLGSDLKKRRVLRNFLPSDDPDAVVAMTERTRRRGADDD